jgi:hypothetical protein
VARVSDSDRSPVSSHHSYAPLNIALTLFGESRMVALSTPSSDESLDVLGVAALGVVREMHERTAGLHLLRTRGCPSRCT